MMGDDEMLARHDYEGFLNGLSESDREVRTFRHTHALHNLITFCSGGRETASTSPVLLHGPAAEMASATTITV